MYFKPHTTPNQTHKRMAKNVAVYFVNYRGFVMMLKDKYSKRWMTPGGNVELGETLFGAMTREFEEETSSQFPKNFIIKKEWCWNQHTMVYLIFSRDQVTKFMETNETIDRRFFHHKEVIKIPNIRSCVRDSFSDLNISQEIESYLKNRW